MFKLKELIKSVSNQTLEGYSSTSHVCHVLVCHTHSLLTSTIIIFSVIDSWSKGKWMDRPGKEETSTLKD